MIWRCKTFDCTCSSNYSLNSAMKNASKFFRVHLFFWTDISIFELKEWLKFFYRYLAGSVFSVKLLSLLQRFSTFLCFSNVLFLTWTWPLYITHKGCGFWLFNLNRTVLVLRIVTKVIFFSPSIRCVNLHFICLYSIWSYLIFSLICKVI